MEIKKFLGIDVGGGSVRGSVIDKSGKLYHEDKIQTQIDWKNEEFLQALIGLVDKIIKVQMPDAIGIGTPGPIDMDLGTIIKSANLSSLRNTPVVSSLKEKFNLPVYFNNDANCAALGEYYFGKGKGSSNVIVLTLGTGLGCGWVYNGQIFNGYKGNGMESGHITVIMHGAACGCGKFGCAEAYFSATGLLNRYKDKTGEELKSAEEFFRKVSEKDDNCVKILQFSTDVLAELIRNLIHAVNPQKVIMVGGLTASYNLFEERLVNRVKNIIWPVFKEYTEIMVGEKIAGSYGAAALCFE